MADRDTTVVFRADVSGLKNGIQQANQSIKESQARFKAASASMDDWTKSSKGIEAKLKELSSVLEQQNKKLQNYRQQLEKQEEAARENGRRAEELKQKLRELAEQGVEETSDEWKKYKKELSRVEAELDRNEDACDKLRINILDQEAAVGKTTKQQRKFEGQLKDVKQAEERAAREGRSVDDVLDEMGDEALQSSKQMDRMGKETHDLGGKFSALKVAVGSFFANLATNALSAAADKLRDFAVNVVTLGKEFDTSMSKVKGISGATAEELVRLEEAARKSGKETVFSASESADALQYMALAGWKTDDMIKGLPSVLNLAAAGQMDLAEASDIVTDYLTAFGLKTKDAAHFSDVMAYAMSNSNTTVEGLGEAYKNCAATAASMGFSVEDTTAVLMTMANAGVKGGEAGTALNAVMTRIATNTANATDMLQELGIKVYDSNGNMVELSEILDGLSKQWGTLTGEEQANLAKIIAGQHHYSAFSTIMQGVSEEAKKGGSSFYDYTKALKTCDGAAEDMAKTMNDNLEGDLKTLNSVWEDFQLTLYKTESGAMRNIVQTVSGKLIPALEALVTGSKDAKEKIVDAFQGILGQIGDIGSGLVTKFFGEKAGAAVKKAFSVIGKALENVFELFERFGPAIGGVIETAAGVVEALLPPIMNILRTLAPLVEKIVEVIGKATKSILPILQSVLEAIGAVLGPICDALEPLLDILGAIFDVIGWVVDGLKWFFSGCPKVAENFDEVTAASDEMVKSLEKNTSAWDSMMKSQTKHLTETGLEIDKISSLKEELDTLVNANGKVKKGYEARAGVIVGQLSEAMGTEINYTNGQIEGYKELEKTIEQLIATKRAAALNDYYQEIIDSYKGGLEQLKADAYNVEQQIAQVNEAISNTSEGTDEYNQLVEQQQQLEAEKSKIYAEQDTYLQALGEQQKLYVAQSTGDYATLDNMMLTHMAAVEKDGVMVKETTQEQIQYTEQYVERLKQKLAEAKATGDKETAEMTAAELKNEQRKLEGLKEKYAQETEANRKAIQSMAGDSESGFSAIVRIATSKGDNAGYGFSTKLGSHAGDAKTAGAKLKSGTNAGMGDMETAGRSKADDYGRGYTNGLSAWWQTVFNKGKSLGQAAGKGTAAGQSSHSPSKVAFKLGQDFDTGYINGLMSMISKVRNTGVKVSKANAEAFKGNQKSALINATGGLQSYNTIAARNGLNGNNQQAASGATVNFTQINNSPKALSRIEIYRQTRNLVQLAKVGVS